MNENKIKKLAYVPAQKVDRIHIGGGCLWVQFEKRIHRMLLQLLL